MRLLLPLVVLSGCVEYELSRFDNKDDFLQDPPAEVDVLVIVDNSFSMEPYQEKLSSNFDAFVSFFTQANVDYRIGVLTTNTLDSDHGAQNGCTPEQVEAIPPAGELVGGAYITPDTPKADKLFSDLVQVGVCGVGLEMGYESAWRSLKIDTKLNREFRRPDASLSLLFVSDEEDGSPLPPRTYVDLMRKEVNALEDRRRFNISALVYTDGEDCSNAQRQAASRGDRFFSGVSATNGILGDICSPDYNGALTDMSLAAARLTEVFFLAEEPDAGTLEVTIDGLIWPCDDGSWTYSREIRDGTEAPAIRFPRTSLPPAGANISVRYSRGSGDEDAFCTGTTATAEEGA
ncbi:MAG: hypothetical protein ACI8PZ_006031 [Myxococcota bacterium]|jgi:hypothetical protein